MVMWTIRSRIFAEQKLAKLDRRLPEGTLARCLGGGDLRGGLVGRALIGRRGRRFGACRRFRRVRGAHRPDEQPRRLAQRTGLRGVVTRHGDDDVVAVDHHLGAGHAEAVDAGFDDALRLLGLSRLGALPSGVRAVSVTRVPPCRSMPSLAVGDLSPVKKINAYTIATIAANSANKRPGCCIDPWDGATVGRSPRVRSRRRPFGSDLAGSLGDTRERAPADAGRACEGPRQITRG